MGTTAFFFLPAINFEEPPEALGDCCFLGSVTPFLIVSNTIEPNDFRALVGDLEPPTPVPVVEGLLDSERDRNDLDDDLIGFGDDRPSGLTSVLALRGDGVDV